MKEELPELRFTPSFWIRFKFFLTNILFLYLSWKFVGDWAVIGKLMIAFFGFGLLVSLYRFIPGKYYLLIDSSGFTTKYNFRLTRYRWPQIDRFFVVKIGSRKTVAFNFSDRDPDLKSKVRPGARVLGFEGILPDDFGCNAEELCDILEKYRNH